MRIITLLYLLFLLLVNVAQAGEFTPTRSYVYPVVTMNDNVKGVASMAGTGSIVIIQSGYALTAAHVLPSERKPVYAVVNGVFSPISIVKIDRTRDLALISTRIGCPCASISNKALLVDQSVATIGYPLFATLRTQVLTTGTFQGMNDINLYISTAQTAPGGSGGGLFAKIDGKYDLAGIVVGVGTTTISNDRKTVEVSQLVPFIVLSVPSPVVLQFLVGTPVRQK